MEHVPEPAAGPSGQIVIDVHAAGVNPVDTYIRSGAQGYSAKLPYTPGLDAAGIVAAVSPDVTSFIPGDRVYVTAALSGSYAAQTLCSVERVFHLPERISFEQGACLGIPYATAYRALFVRARALPGETVLVHGASGGVGLAAVQIARAAGLTVIGTAGSELGLELVRQHGAHMALDHGITGHLDQAVEFTGGKGVSIIIEMLANVNLGSDLPALSRGGRVVVIGSRGPVEITPRELMRRDASIHGMTLFNASPSELAMIHAAIYAGLAGGFYNPPVGRTLALDEAANAHRLIIESKAAGNIVLVP